MKEKSPPCSECKFSTIEDKSDVVCNHPKLDRPTYTYYIRGNAVMGRCNYMGNWFEQKQSISDKEVQISFWNKLRDRLFKK